LRVAVPRGWCGLAYPKTLALANFTPKHTDERGFLDTELAQGDLQIVIRVAPYPQLERRTFTLSELERVDAVTGPASAIVSAGRRSYDRTVYFGRGTVTQRQLRAADAVLARIRPE
jgi:hypothetical protein